MYRVHKAVVIDETHVICKNVSQFNATLLPE